MKLFENSVGRPTNKIKKQRKIFCISAIILSALLFFTIITLLVKVENVKAALGFVSPYVSIKADTFSNKISKGDTVNLNINLKYFGKRDYYFKVAAHVGTSYETSSCQKFLKGSKKITYPLKITNDNTYVALELYNNAPCTKLYRTVTGPKFMLSDKPSNSKVKTFIATFYKNGADSIGAEKLSCTTKSSSCTIKAPSIKREGYKVNGWALNSLTVAKYKPGDTITLKKDMKFFARTTKKINSTIISDVIDIINSNNKAKISMTKYSTNWEIGYTGNIDVVTTPDSDTVTLTSSNPFVMRLNKTGNKTWKMTAVDAGEATITATSSSGATISSVYTVSSYEYLGTSRMKKGCKSKITLNDVVIYRENGVSDSVYNAYLTDFKELPNYMKKGTKELYILTQATFNLYHNSGARGVTMSKQGYSIIDIRAEKYSSGCYNALPHEFAHAVDGRYKHVYGNGRISESKDWSNLYNYYKNHQGNVLWYNAYANKGEFFADSYAFYFMKYQAKTHTFNKSYYSNKAYPDNIKKQMYDTINFINNTSM